MNRKTTFVLLAALALSLVATSTAQSCPKLVLSGPQELIPTDALSKFKLFFGKYLRISGDWIIVGAYGHSNYKGAAYMFRFNGNKWKFRQVLKADVRQPKGYYGLNVAISGLTAVVGEPYSQTSGRAHVYEMRGSNKWTNTQVLRPPGNPSDSRPFGYGVGIEGNILAVAARYANKMNGSFTTNERSGAGGIFVYTRSGPGASFNLYDVLYGPNAYDQWGDDVLIRGSLPGDTGGVRIMLGAPRHAPNRSGAAYTFKMQPGGSLYGRFSFEQVLQPDESGIPSDFGNHQQHHGEGIGLGLTTAVEAGERAPTPNGVKTGAAYVWNLENGVWVQKQRLDPAPVDDGGVKHGQRLAIDEKMGVIVVGTWGAWNKGQNKAGAWRYYVRCSDGSWSAGKRVKLPNPGFNDQYGNCVDIDGTNIIIGAPKRDSGSNPALQERGAAYVYTYKLK